MFFFFFSSRRRHTRSLRDWSSDVCSSDLLFNAQPLREVLEGLVRHLSGGAHAELPVDPGEQIDVVLTHLRASRCLIVLDNLETLFRPGATTGEYLPGYQDYGQLLRGLATTAHRSS